MTSAINPNNIDGTYPVAGQDNSSQGFRDNFTNIKSNFLSAYNEISDLQSKVILKSPLSDGTFNNDMQGNVITNALTQGFRDLLYSLGTVSGAIIIDFNAGSYQTMTLGGSTSISFANFVPTSGSFARIKIQVTVNNPNYTLTLPASVSVATATIAGLNSNIISFDEAGVYNFEFGTTNGGVSFNIVDITRNRDTVQGGSFTVSKYINGNLANGISMTVSNVAGVVTGNIYASYIFGNIISTAGNSASYTGNLQANYLIANSGVVGTLVTASQPNITLVGTLSSLSVSANANIGNLVVTGITDMCAGTQYGLQYATNVSNPSSVTIQSNVGVFILGNSTTMASYTITMPTTPVNGQSIKIGFGQTVTALTHTVTGGQTLFNPLSTANVGAGGEWVYFTGTSSWYKVA